MCLYLKCDSREEFEEIESKINKAMLDNGFYFQYWAKIKDENQKPPYLITIPLSGDKYEIIMNCLTEEEKSKMHDYTSKEIEDLGVENV